MCRGYPLQKRRDFSSSFHFLLSNNRHLLAFLITVIYLYYDYLRTIYYDGRKFTNVLVKSMATDRTIAQLRTVVRSYGVILALSFPKEHLY